MSKESTRGGLQWEYLPPRAHPILYAGLLVFGAVFLMGSFENLLRENSPRLYAIYAAPVLAVALIMLALWPNTVRIYDAGIAPSRPLLMRAHQPFLAWDDAAAAYPAYYDVTGAFVSPFASSDGKVTQMGLHIEMQDGHQETIRFTPTRFVLGQQRSAGFVAALKLVRAAFESRGRLTVDQGEQLDEATKREMIAEATKPFLPFVVIVFLFASAAPLLLLLNFIGIPVGVAFLASLIPPLATSLHSYRQSLKRNAILNRLSKAAEANAVGSRAAAQDATSFVAPARPDAEPEAGA